MASHRMVLWIWVLSVVLLVLAAGSFGCAANELSEPKPDAPDTAATVQPYVQGATLPLNAEVVGAVVERLRGILVLAQPLCGWDSVQDLVCTGDTCSGQPASCAGFSAALAGVKAAGKDDEETQQQTLGADSGLEVQRLALDIAGTGFMRVKRTCNGWGAEPVADRDANGYVDLVVGFTDNGLDRVIWGDFHGCKYLVNGQQLFIEGAVTLTFSDPVNFKTFDDLKFVVGLEAENLSFNDQVFTGNFDFALLISSGVVEIKIDVADKHLLLVVSGSQVILRAENGDWVCDLSAATCTNADTGAVLGVNLP